MRVDDTDIPWREMVADYHRELPLDGYTSWRDVTELPGDGSFAPDRVYHPAAGILPGDFGALLLRALPDRVRDQQWHAERHLVLSTSGVVLARPSLGTAETTSSETTSSDVVGGSGESPPAARPAAVQAVTTGTLTELMTAWSGNRFPGRAWSGDGRVGIAAPPYPDSLVVSGPLGHRARPAGAPQPSARGCAVA